MLTEGVSICYDDKNIDVSLSRIFLIHGFSLPVFCTMVFSSGMFEVVYYMFFVSYCCFGLGQVSLFVKEMFILSMRLNEG